jgi:hypothetical protein
LANGKGKKGGGAVGEVAGGLFVKQAKELFRVGKSKKIIGLDAEKVDAKTRQKWRDKRQSQKAQPDTKVSSRKIDPEDPNLPPEEKELVDAVREAVRQDEYSGGKNYAAIRFIDTDGQERILVTRSDGVHSERMGGNYLLDRIGPENVKMVYTERSPCNFSSSYCDEWMKLHIPDAEVRHGFNYGIEGTSKAEANKQVRAHRGWQLS